MPFVKRLVTSRQLNSGFKSSSDDVDLNRRELFCVCQLLACLAQHAEEIFGELLAECHHISNRTNRINTKLRSGLYEKIVNLNAKQEFELRKQCSDAETDCQQLQQPFQAKYGYCSALFTPASRPATIQHLYQSADISPLAAGITQCDQLYRSDGLVGAHIFSRHIVVSDNQQLADDSSVDLCLSSGVVGGNVTEPSHRYKSPRPPVITTPQPAGLQDEDIPQTPATPDMEQGLECEAIFVPIDVTGFTHQFSRREPYLCDINSNDITVDSKPLAVTSGSQRARTRSEPLDSSTGFGFTVIQTTLQHRSQINDRKEVAAQRRSVSESRIGASRVVRTSAFMEKYAPTSGQQQSRGRTTVRQLKKKNRSTLTAAAGAEDSNICSWRHSLCVGFGVVKDEIDDLWAEVRPEPVPVNTLTSQCQRVDATVDRSLTQVHRDTDKTLTPMRSQSLPRTFRASLIAPFRRLLSSRAVTPTSTSASSSPTVSNEKCSIRTRSDSDSKITASASPAAAAPVTPTEPTLSRSRSLERPSSRRTLRASRSSLKGATVIVSGGNGCEEELNGAGRQVYVDIPDQPWTKPFATVQLRNRQIDADEYQSSSGHWSGGSGVSGSGVSGVSGSVCHSAQLDSLSSFSETQLNNDKDSAVSLTINFDNRTEDINKQLGIHTRDADSQSTNSRTEDQLSDSRTGGSSVGDELSLFSVDQDGFFTSMHADSGLPTNQRRRSPVTTYHHNGTCHSNGSTSTLVAGSNTDSSSNESLRTLSMADLITPSDAELQTSVNSSSQQITRTVSAEIKHDKNCEQLSSVADPQSTACSDDTLLNSPASESTVTIPGFNKCSLNFTAGTFPSFCTVTPPSSGEEEEDLDLIGCRTEWSSSGSNGSNGCNGCLVGNMSSCLSPSMTVSTPVSCDMTRVTSAGSTLLDSPTASCPSVPKDVRSEAVKNGVRGNSTWPCSPVLKLDDEICLIRSILKPSASSSSSSSNKSSTQQSKTLTFSPSVVDSTFSPSVVDSTRETLPGACGAIPFSLSCTSVASIETAEIKATNSSTNNSNNLSNTSTANDTLAESPVSVVPSSEATSNMVPGSIQATLVISTPVKMHAKYVENCNQRFVCNAVTCQELEFVDKFSSPVHWSGTFPRSRGSLARKHGIEKQRLSGSHMWERNDQRAESCCRELEVSQHLCSVRPNFCKEPTSTKTISSLGRKYHVAGFTGSLVAHPVSSHSQTASNGRRSNSLVKYRSSPKRFERSKSCREKSQPSCHVTVVQTGRQSASSDVTPGGMQSSDVCMRNVRSRVSESDSMSDISATGLQFKTSAMHVYTKAMPKMKSGNQNVTSVNQMLRQQSALVDHRFSNQVASRLSGVEDRPNNVVVVDLTRGETGSVETSTEPSASNERLGVCQQSLAVQSSNSLSSTLSAAEQCYELVSVDNNERTNSHNNNSPRQFNILTKYGNTEVPNCNNSINELNSLNSPNDLSHLPSCTGMLCTGTSCTGMLSYSSSGIGSSVSSSLLISPDSDSIPEHSRSTQSGLVVEDHQSPHCCVLSSGVAKTDRTKVSDNPHVARFQQKLNALYRKHPTVTTERSRQTAV